MSVLRALVLAVWAGCCGGIYVELGHAQRACYLVDVPSKPTPVQGTYDVRIRQGEATVKLEALNSRRDTVHTVTVTPDANTFAFKTAGDQGQYTLCWKAENRDRDAVTKITFEYHLGSGKRHKPTPKGKPEAQEEDPHIDELEDVHFEMEQAEDLLEEILDAIANFRLGQETFKEGASLIKNNVWWFGVFQVLVMAGLATYQVHSLQRFLVEKKMV